MRLITLFTLALCSLLATGTAFAGFNQADGVPYCGGSSRESRAIGLRLRDARARPLFVWRSRMQVRGPFESVNYQRQHPLRHHHTLRGGGTARVLRGR